MYLLCLSLGSLQTSVTVPAVVVADAASFVSIIGGVAHTRIENLLLKQTQAQATDWTLAVSILSSGSSIAAAVAVAECENDMEERHRRTTG